jgi:hypothetical protein
VSKVAGISMGHHQCCDRAIGWNEPGVQLDTILGMKPDILSAEKLLRWFVVIFSVWGGEVNETFFEDHKDECPEHDGDNGRDKERDEHPTDASFGFRLHEGKLSELKRKIQTGIFALRWSRGTEAPQGDILNQTFASSHSQMEFADKIERL